MDLSTLARVKQYVSVGSSTAADTLLSRLISAYSDAFEVELGRYTQEDFRQEEIELERGVHFILLRAAPVVAVTSVQLTGSASFDDVDALETSAYHVAKSDGSVRLLIEQPYEPAFVRVSYVGGMAPNTTLFISRYPRIAEALDQQVAYHFQRKDRQGGNVSVGAGGTQYEGQLKLLDSVKEVLSQYGRRYA